MSPRATAALIAAAIAALVFSAAAPASAQQFVPAPECLAGGGIILPDVEGSPTGFVCHRGDFDGYWVTFFG
ncbi:hypothetical protein HNR23_003640 [Nocardiopsis mwathae]|uniref:Secreted protein n=1 Tax=Nocardiopsis mwathae TaxID=1472723 RepID=A0A7W9YKD9_9ACTN|nr:hypothetical protein [Nocardiopsis mwathae]MBB6173580.1 hypothetical protein [Nocardiopsis mwathae]